MQEKSLDMRSPFYRKGSHGKFSLSLLWANGHPPPKAMVASLWEKLLWESDEHSKPCAQKNVNLHRDTKYCLEFHEDSEPSETYPSTAKSPQQGTTYDIQTGKIAHLDFVSLKCNKLKSLDKNLKKIKKFSHSNSPHLGSVSTLSGSK